MGRIILGPYQTPNLMKIVLLSCRLFRIIALTSLEEFLLIHYTATIATTLPPNSLPLPPSCLAYILLVGSIAFVLQEALVGIERNLDPQDAKAIDANLKDHNITTTKSGAPSVESSQLIGLEVGQMNLKFSY
jgi:hypothetical protein